MKIVIVETFPVRGKEETSNLLNQKISRIARSSASNAQPIMVSETNRGFDRNQDMCNGGDFPNAGGARKIAAKQAEALHPLLGPSRNQSIPKP